MEVKSLGEKRRQKGSQIGGESGKGGKRGKRDEIRSMEKVTRTKCTYCMLPTKTGTIVGRRGIIGKKGGRREKRGKEMGDFSYPCGDWGGCIRNKNETGGAFTQERLRWGSKYKTGEREREIRRAKTVTAGGHEGDSEHNEGTKALS